MSICRKVDVNHVVQSLQNEQILPLVERKVDLKKRLEEQCTQVISKLWDLFDILIPP